MNLPPLTFTQAANLYKSISQSDGGVLALVPPNEVLPTLASALVVFGRQLERDQKVILEQKDSIEELNAHLRAYLDDHLAGRLESDLSDEALVRTYNPNRRHHAVESAISDNCALCGVEFSDSIHMTFDESPQVTAVEWRGPAGNYFDRFPEINKELAKGISEMARQNIEAEDKGVIEG